MITLLDRINKIQTIKIKTYGYHNMDRFINAICFHCGSLDMYPR